MRLTLSTLTMACALALAASSQAAPPSLTADDGPQVSESVCGAQEISREEQLAVQQGVEDWIAENGQPLSSGGNIKVVWHVIYNGSAGNIPQSQIDAQMAVLNSAFAGIPGGVNTGYTFTLVSVDRTNNKKWYTMEPGSLQERQAKNALAIDVRHRLNIYSCKSNSGASWGIFPWTFPENDKLHGVVLNILWLPNGPYPQYYTGDIGVHEVGHYLGLFHTFQGGCTPPGDQVDDTPYESVSTQECADENRDSCPAPGLDPIHNYMDYSFDECRIEFTQGQDDRMDNMVTVYRPNLLNAPRVFDDTAALEPAGNHPNPFNPRTTISFTLGHAQAVSLRVYDVQGKLVRTLIDGQQAAGHHEAIWEGRDDRGGQVASGTYFYRLRTDEGAQVHKMVLLK